MILAFSAIPVRDLDTRDELGTPVGSELERDEADEEARCYRCLTFFSHLHPVHVFFREVKSGALYSITFLSHLPFSGVLSLIYVPLRFQRDHG